MNFDENVTKKKYTYLVFEKKKTQNEISTGKINSLNNSDKTSKNGCVEGVIHGKNMKRLCSGGDLCPKFGGGGAVTIITQRFKYPPSPWLRAVLKK